MKAEGKRRKREKEGGATIFSLFSVWAEMHFMSKIGKEKRKNALKTEEKFASIKLGARLWLEIFPIFFSYTILLTFSPLFIQI